MKTLEENVRMYVAALATSGNNFAVEGEYSPISEELKDEYVKSLMALISEAVNKARIEEVQRLTSGNTKFYKEDRLKELKKG